MIETRCGLYTKQGQRIPLKGVEVTGQVFGGHAQVTVRQRYRNEESRPVEAVYTFPLPSDATLVGFAMTCAGRRLEGVVREREQAFREYDEAIASGHGAALVDQERPNVFTSQVGNLLPNEETVVEVSYVQRVKADEGQLRWSIPTLVAPRYIPGNTQGDRTGHGAASPTDRVPDADRITPPIGEVHYGLSLEVTFDTGRAVQVESPSHAITVSDDSGRTRVRLAQPEVALDRDVVLTARGVEKGPFTAIATHKEPGKQGTFALTIIPDLFQASRVAAPQDVVFLIDVSGSMDGASITEARNALRLCLRHLREGDRFNIIAFNERFRSLAPSPLVFAQRTLEQADAWVQGLEADGGTELLEPLLYALKSAPDATVVLLTDGQVGNEQEILEKCLATRRRARLFSFGIGTNVSDTLLRDLARESGGDVEFIHPGERVDDKVLAQFARAIAPRVDEVSVTFEGLAVSDLAPVPMRPLVDGEPWVLFGRYDGEGTGRVELRGARHLPGDRAPEPFTLSLPLSLPASAQAPHLPKLWASERVRDLEVARLTGRRAESNKERIVRLAVEQQIVTAFTSFVVIEHRTGARLAHGQPETRVVPVNVPAGWDMFQQKGAAPGSGAMPKLARIRAGVLMPAPVAAAAPRRAGGFAPPSPPAAYGRADDWSTGVKAESLEYDEGEAFAEEQDFAAEPPADAGGRGISLDALPELEETAEKAKQRETDQVTLLLSKQLASGLWNGSNGDEVKNALATARALLLLLRLGVTTSHPLHGAQLRKAVMALAPLLASVQAKEPKVAEFAAAVLWLVATGPRSRGEVENALVQDSVLATLRGTFTDEAALRTRVDAMASRL